MIARSSPLPQRLCGLSTGAPARRIHARKLANVFEFVYSNGFNSPSMVGISSVTVG